MSEKRSDKIFRIQLEIALEKMERATRLASHIDSDASWVTFDEACIQAVLLIHGALPFVPKGNLVEDKAKLNSSLNQLQALRTQAWENWQMLWREQQAVADPTGKYGVMKAEREITEDIVKDSDDYLFNPN